MGTEYIIFEDLGIVPYKRAWDYQEELVNENLKKKTKMRERQRQQEAINITGASVSELIGRKAPPAENDDLNTTHHLLFCEHPPVYTLGKSGHMENVLLSAGEMNSRHIEFFKTNRGGDITFHGPQQLVGYPILDLEKFETDIGKYLRNLEEVIIRTLGEYGIEGERSQGETGVWIEPGIKGRERKICAMGIRCSRWVTMHGFALNVNTDLTYFNHIIPCGIVNKQVTSIEKELGSKVGFEEIKEKVKINFETIFKATLGEKEVVK